LAPDGAAGTRRSRFLNPSQRDRERFKPFHDRGWSAEAQLDAMDAEGIDAGVIYPTRGLFAPGLDGMEPKFAAAVARAEDKPESAAATEVQRDPETARLTDRLSAIFAESPA